MKYVIDNKEYNVIIKRKNNKNTYIRIKNGNIYITTNYFTLKKEIIKLIENNKEIILKMIDRSEKKRINQDKFYYLGKCYDVIFSGDSIVLSDNIIFTPNLESLNSWLKKQTCIIFKNRLDYIYGLFEESIPYPNLKIRKMTTRWGVCNRVKNNVTLNSDLIKFSYEQIDYVIVHELAHFVYFDHSKNFWNLVSKYCSNYKKIRKSLND